MSSYTFGRCLKLIRYRKVGLQMTLDFTTEMTAREGRATQRVSTISSQHGHDFSKNQSQLFLNLYFSKATDLPNPLSREGTKSDASENSPSPSPNSPSPTSK